MWELLTDTHRKANKKHNCDECGRVINKGETYLNRKGLWEGDSWVIIKLCPECEKLWEEAMKYYDVLGVDIEEITVGELRQNLEEDGYYEEENNV